MGLFDKIKNLFYDEEVIEVPKESIEEEIKVNSKNNKEDEHKTSIDNVISERDLVKKDTNFKFPIIFDDDDFVDKKEEKKKEKIKEEQNYSRVNEHQTKYKKPTLDREVIKEVIEKPKKFKPSPVISPVYGILDKNYRKEELENKEKDELEKTKELVINFDTIRQKAYGSLSDDIEKELEHEDKKINKIDQIEKEIDDILVENNLLTDLEEEPVEVKKVEVEEDNEYSYSDFGVEYKISEEPPKEEKKKRKTRVQEHEDEIIINNEPDDEPEVEEEIVDPIDDDIQDVKENEENEELTDDLFNLIDSMYDR